MPAQLSPISTEEINLCFEKFKSEALEEAKNGHSEDTCVPCGIKKAFLCSDMVEVADRLGVELLMPEVITRAQISLFFAEAIIMGIVIGHEITKAQDFRKVMGELSEM